MTPTVIKSLLDHATQTPFIERDGVPGERLPHVLEGLSHTLAVKDPPASVTIVLNNFLEKLYLKLKVSAEVCTLYMYYTTFVYYNSISVSDGMFFVCQNISGCLLGLISQTTSIIDKNINNK